MRRTRELSASHRRRSCSSAAPASIASALRSAAAALLSAACAVSRDRLAIYERGSVSTGVRPPPGLLTMHTPTSPAFTVCIMDMSPPNLVSQCLLNSAAVGLLSPQDARAAATRAAKIRLRVFGEVFMVLRPRPRQGSVRRASPPTFLSARKAARSVARHTSGIGGPTAVLEPEAGSLPGPAASRRLAPDRVLVSTYLGHLLSAVSRK